MAFRKLLRRSRRKERRQPPAVITVPKHHSNTQPPIETNPLTQNAVPPSVPNVVVVHEGVADNTSSLAGKDHPSEKQHKPESNETRLPPQQEEHENAMASTPNANATAWNKMVALMEMIALALLALVAILLSLALISLWAILVMVSLHCFQCPVLSILCFTLCLVAVEGFLIRWGLGWMRSRTSTVATIVSAHTTDLPAN